MIHPGDLHEFRSAAAEFSRRTRAFAATRHAVGCFLHVYKDWRVHHSTDHLDRGTDGNCWRNPIGGHVFAPCAVSEGCRELAALFVSSLSQQRDPMDTAGVWREDGGSRISHHSQFHLTYLGGFAVAWRLAT